MHTNWQTRTGKIEQLIQQIIQNSQIICLTLKIKVIVFFAYFVKLNNRFVL